MAHLTKRKVLSDLSGGWCRNYSHYPHVLARQFLVTITNYVLYMAGLDGGLIPDDEDSSSSMSRN
ncbi:uncharacterized protein N7473_004013 [Penicillium subrubescens]|uniref:uncharacterized protein n=1 Tax=Penicillium subrubescens TaxID=1316194 RepID=UPI002544E1B4|nr:uncharacterized protein N7473_004013 [Penicillium subrubescens]KAJ5907097.1 hypothetical protein N7473_004013 [Penicillium subrubescens]